MPRDPPGLAVLEQIQEVQPGPAEPPREEEAVPALPGPLMEGLEAEARTALEATPGTELVPGITVEHPAEILACSRRRPTVNPFITTRL